MKKTFLSGAMLLMIANAVSKILGAILKIPLTYIVNEEGMAIYNTAFNVYVMFLSFVTTGVPFAVQKLTAASYACGDNARAAKTVKTAFVMLAAVGAAATVILWYGAEFFAAAMKEQRAERVIRAIAPSVFFVACAEVLKSGFQGRTNMLPTAVSQVVEAFIKLVSGYLLASFLVKRSMDEGVFGAGLGVTAGEMAAALLLVLWYLWGKVNKKVKVEKTILREVMNIALPMLCISVTCSAIAVCDTSVIRMSLIRSGLDEATARFIYGAYTGYAMTVLNLPIGLLATLGVCVVPVVSGAVAMGNKVKMHRITGRVFRLAFFCSLSAALFLFLFGEEMLQILFKNTYSTNMLRLAAPSVVFVCMMHLSGTILQSMGFMGCAYISSVSAALIKLTCSALLVPRPELNIFGVIIGNNVAFFVGMVMNLVFIKKKISVIKSECINT